MIVIAKETPHMFMWFTDGSKIPSGLSPLPQNAKLNYVQRLKDECSKLLLTQTPAYLIYMGRLLNNEQKKLLINLQKEIPNLAVIDYDELEQHISDEHLIRRVAVLAESYKQHEKLGTGAGGIADLVDLTRIILIYNSNILRELAQKQIKYPVKWQQGLIYRDFDVTLEKESMPDIPTKMGYMATLNFLEQTHALEADLIKASVGKEVLIQKIQSFFNTYIYNLERYQQVISLFANKKLTEEQQEAKDSITLEFKKIAPAFDFKHSFINVILIENSFLAVNADQHPLIAKIIKGIANINSPYGSVQFFLGGDIQK